MLLDAPSVLDAWAFPNETAADLAQCTPHSVLVDVLGELTPATLTVDGQIDALVAVQRHMALLQALETELLAAVDAGDDSPDGFTRDSVAAALRVPPASLRTRMVLARDVADRFPDTLDLLRAGVITQRQALDLADLTHSLSAESAAVVEAEVLPRAPEQTAARFRVAVRRAVLRVTDAAAEEKAHRDAVAERRVEFHPADRGMAWVNCYLSAQDAATLMAAVEAIAYETIHGKGGDTRTGDQRRADAIVEMACSFLADPFLVKARGQRPAVQVTVAASTLMGLDDQAADLDGYGPITAAMARRIASDPTARWRRLLTDDEGLVRSAGVHTYRPPADMVRTVIARDAHCQFPGCRRKAQYDDQDHVEAWREGDETTEANLLSLCRRHHRLKHSGRWTIDRDDRTGVTIWTDRKGRQYLARAPLRPTTTTGTPPPVPAAENTAGSVAPPAGPRLDGPPWNTHRRRRSCPYPDSRTHVSDPEHGQRSTSILIWPGHQARTPPRPTDRPPLATPPRPRRSWGSSRSRSVGWPRSSRVRATNRINRRRHPCRA